MSLYREIYEYENRIWDLATRKPKAGVPIEGPGRKGGYWQTINGRKVYVDKDAQPSQARVKAKPKAPEKPKYDDGDGRDEPTDKYQPATIKRKAVDNVKQKIIAALEDTGPNDDGGHSIAGYKFTREYGKGDEGQPTVRYKVDSPKGETKYTTWRDSERISEGLAGKAYRAFSKSFIGQTMDGLEGVIRDYDQNDSWGERQTAYEATKLWEGMVEFEAKKKEPTKPKKPKAKRKPKPKPKRKQAWTEEDYDAIDFDSSDDDDD